MNVDPSLISLIVSAGTLIVGYLSHKKKASIDYTDRLEKMIKELEGRIARCESHREELKDENLDLMKKFIISQNKPKEG